MDTKLGRVLIYHWRLLLLMAFWQFEKFISPLSRDLWSLNLAGWSFSKQTLKSGPTSSYHNCYCVGFYSTSTCFNFMGCKTITGNSKMERIEFPRFSKIQMNVQKWQFMHMRILPMSYRYCKNISQKIFVAEWKLYVKITSCSKDVYIMHTRVYSNLFLYIFM